MIEHQTLSLDAAVEGETYDHCRLTVSQHELKLAGVTFSNCQFEQTDFRGGEWLDCTIKGSQFLNADFTESVMYRCQFSGCQLMGADFTRCVWHQVTVTDCQASYLILAESKLKAVSFKETQLTESSFQAVKLLKPGLTVTGGELTGADFSGTPLKLVDLSQSRFDSLLFTPSLLRGLKLNQWQAATIAASLGIDVVD